LYGKGINQLGEIIDLGVKCDLIEKSGSWYAYNGNKIGQGKSKACEYLLENESTTSEIEEKIREQLMPTKKKGNQSLESAKDDFTDTNELETIR
jgi:recombination protein RecA